MYLQKIFLLPQIMWQENTQGQPKDGECAFKFEYDYVWCIHQGTNTHASSYRFIFDGIGGD
jgi:hypothetical protein